jgi:hypothetical protein
MKDLRVDGKMILKLILKESFGSPCTGLIWLRIGTRAGPL